MGDTGNTGEVGTKKSRGSGARVRGRMTGFPAVKWIGLERNGDEWTKCGSLEVVMLVVVVMLLLMMVIVVAMRMDSRRSMMMRKKRMVMMRMKREVE